ncbi:hypothetical protein AgCh_039374 [Apium graveolens]
MTGLVKFGDGSTVDIKGKGTVVFKCKNGEEKLLRDVYFIPMLRNDIVSLGQTDGNKVILEGEYLWVYDEIGRLLMRVRRSPNRLYKISLEESAPMCLLTKAEETTWLWHTTMGHVNFQVLTRMSKGKMAYGLPDLVQPKKTCEGCLMSKQARKPFPSQTDSHSKKPLELIHGDICGPISPPIPAGNRYFLLLVDDFTRKMWVYMLKEKNEAFESFKKFKGFVEKEVNGEIKAGIVRHFTAPYTPQQNGVVERRNRIVVAMTRSLLKGTKMPAYMWGEAVRQSVYLLNRLPTRALSDMTPYEAWRGKKPDLKHIRLFGCVAYMKVPQVHVKKLDDRSMTVVYLGKEPGTKASRLYDPVGGRLHVSRDVIYQEDKVWPWNEQGAQGGEVTFPSSYITVTTVDGENESTENITDSVDETNTPVHTEAYTPVHTPVSSQQSSFGNVSTDGENSSPTLSDASSEPRKFRLLDDIYNETEEVEIDEEMLMLSVEEPTSYSQAAKEKEWRDAMKTELNSIEKNKTWVLSDLPQGHKAIGMKWVYKIKKDMDGNVIKHKARLVARGYVQQQGIDYEEVFAPVTRMETVRLILALVAKYGWEVHHMDVKSTFLNREIQEEAPRAWYARLKKCLEGLGFEKCSYEHAVYTKREGHKFLIIGVYVDDLLITGSTVKNIQKFKEQMLLDFDMSDLGKLSYYLGIEVEQRRGIIELRQTGYAKRLLEKAGMLSCNPTRHPMEAKVQLSRDTTGKAVDSTMFKSLVGGLRYLAHTRPDISYVVGMVSRFMERPTVQHLNAVKQILRYISGTLEFGLTYAENSGNHMLCGYSDSDLGGNIDDRKSTGGMVFYLSESLIT